MTERDTVLSRPLVVGHKRDGRRCYDREAKRELIEASMQPGVSVAGMALRHGINANLLRTWIRRYQLEGDKQRAPANGRDGAVVAPSLHTRRAGQERGEGQQIAPGGAATQRRGLSMEGKDANQYLLAPAVYAKRM